MSIKFFNYKSDKVCTIKFDNKKERDNLVTYFGKHDWKEIGGVWHSPNEPIRLRV